MSVGLPSRYVLSHATVVWGEAFSAVPDARLVIEHGTITAFESGPDVAGDFPDDLPTYDVTGKLLIPAFVNAHTHVGDYALRAAVKRADVRSAILPPNGSRNAMLAALPRSELVEGIRQVLETMVGTGTVAFGDFREGGVAGLAALDEAMVGFPLEVVAFGRHAAPPFEPQELAANTASLGPEERREAAALCHRGSGVSLVTANDYTDTALREVRELARSHGAMVTAHASETPWSREESLARTGRSDVARLLDAFDPDLLVHMTCADAADFDRLAAAGTPVVVCPSSQALLGNGIIPIVELLQRGVTVGLGTDNALLSDADMLQELQLAFRFAHATPGGASQVDARRALQMATRDGAHALGLDDRLGTLDIGMDASMVMFDLSRPHFAHGRDPIESLVLWADADDLTTVLIQGRQVLDNCAMDRC